MLPGPQEELRGPIILRGRKSSPGYRTIVCISEPSASATGRGQPDQKGNPTVSHPVVHFEIISPNYRKSAQFYNQLFG